MNWSSFLTKIQSRILAIGSQRLIGAGVAFTLLIAIAIFATVRLMQPTYQILYSGLSKQDAAKISVALRDANISFDASADSATMYVPFGQAPKVRMILARRGLPNSTSSGYELFDKVGSFGLTSFMQEMTKLRALEGELSRTIQTLEGIKTARVHIVMPDPNSFRARQEPPSASVVIEAHGLQEEVPVAAIRHVIASALPGLKVHNVTIATTNGALLASPSDPKDETQTRTIALERNLSNQVRKNISEALTPYFSSENIKISVITRVDADRKESIEKTFLPNSRVERSVQVIKENSDLKNGESGAPTTVAQNIPTNTQNKTPTTKTEASQKRSETTNYEISHKTTNTNYSGYQIKSLSVAVVLNKAVLPNEFTAKSAENKLKQHITEIEKIIEAASGLQPKRGDRLKVALVEFKKIAPEQPSQWSVGNIIIPNLGILINGLFITATALLIIVLGVRPALRVVSKNREPAPSDNQIMITQKADLIDNPEQLTYKKDDIDPLLGDEAAVKNDRKKLQRLIQRHEDDAVTIMKQWIAKDAA